MSMLPIFLAICFDARVNASTPARAQLSVVTAPLLARRVAIAMAVTMVTAGACRSGGEGDDEVEGSSQSESGGASDSSDSSATSEDSESTGEDSESTTETGEPGFEGYDQPGPHPVGTRAFALPDPLGERDLEVQLWYPAAQRVVTGDPIGDFVTTEPNAEDFGALVDTAPEPCTRKQTSSAFDVEPAAVEAPLATVVFSHCHTCTRFSSYSLAERLASHGFLVAAVDHAGNTLFDLLAGDPLPVDAATLELRFVDMQRVIDELLDPNASALPPNFVGLADPDRLGVFGHSFGSVTTGKLLQDDDRVRAGVGIAAPFESPLLPGIAMANIEEPVLFLVAVEDNSITEIGNNILRSNFMSANTPAWKIEFGDAGHWSFSDICNLVEDFQPGCGEGQRQTNPAETFEYLDNELARGLAATRVAAFFAMTLRGEAEARNELEAPDPVLEVEVRE
jgi:dienelactone hydrolase